MDIPTHRPTDRRDQQALGMQRLLTSCIQSATMAGLKAPAVQTLPDESVEGVAALIAKEGIHMLGYLVGGDGQRPMLAWGGGEHGCLYCDCRLWARFGSCWYQA